MFCLYFTYKGPQSMVWCQLKLAWNMCMVFKLIKLAEIVRGEVLNSSAEMGLPKDGFLQCSCWLIWYFEKLEVWKFLLSYQDMDRTMSSSCAPACGLQHRDGENEIVIKMPSTMLLRKWKQSTGDWELTLFPKQS